MPSSKAKDNLPERQRVEQWLKDNIREVGK